MTIHKSRYRRPVTLLAAIIVALFGTLSAPGAPAAQAGPFLFTLCDLYPHICHPLYVTKPFPWPPPPDCPMCGLMIDWQLARVLPITEQNAFRTDIIAGIHLLSRAAFTTDPAASAGLRADALAQFTSAASHARGTTVAPGGWSILKITATGDWSVLDPTQPIPWVDASAADIADGIGLLQLAAQNPTAAARYQALAMGQFDEAYSELSQQEVIAG